MGGHENISEELEETMIQFGKLAGTDDEKLDSSPSVRTTSIPSMPQSQGTGSIVQLDSTLQNAAQEATDEEDLLEEGRSTSFRAGFCLAHEVES